MYGLYSPDKGTVRVVDPASDPRLPALGRFLPGGELVAYRPTRRAVVRLRGTGGGPPRYAKVLRPGRVAPIVARHRAAEAAGLSSPSFPPVLEWSDDEGFVVLGAMLGRSLHAAGRGGVLPAVAAALAALHGVAPGELAPVTARPLEAWTASVAPFLDPATVARYGAALAELPAAPVGAQLVHGDLHDGNVFVADGAVGVIDLDSLGTGHPAIDVGNLAAHLVLRSLQATGQAERGRHLARQLVREYVGAGGPADEPAIAAAMTRSLFRLACVYVVRPRWKGVCPALLLESARSNPGSSG